MSQATNQSWGGRFSEPTDAFVARFTASVNFDQRLARQDIQGSIAHATMLARVGVLTEEERKKKVQQRRVAKLAKAAAVEAAVEMVVKTSITAIYR